MILGTGVDRMVPGWRIALTFGLLQLSLVLPPTVMTGVGMSNA
jgi:hypothetical protein